MEDYYAGEASEKIIKLEEIPELNQQPLYICLDTKELTNYLDLKKEVILTMLNQLEQVEGGFFKVCSVLPASIGMRFHKGTLDEMVESVESFF